MAWDAEKMKFLREARGKPAGGGGSLAQGKGWPKRKAFWIPLAQTLPGLVFLSVLEEEVDLCLWAAAKFHPLRALNSAENWANASKDRALQLS